MSNRANAMKNSLTCLAIVMPLGLAAGACMNDPNGLAPSSNTAASSTYIGGDLGTLTYRAVDLVLASAPQVRADTPLLVASVSNVENVESSSAFGNIVSDLIRTRLVQDGHPNSEVRLRRSLSFDKGEGEFMLSRDSHVLMGAPTAAAIVTGTYAAGYEKVYVSIKVVSVTDAHIIAGADFVVPFQEVAGLLHKQDT
jgi:hypothetical protein